MACAMNAQDFHGISIGGTLQAPTIVNHADKAVYAYVLVISKDTTRTDYNTGEQVPYTLTYVVFSSDRIILRGGIKPGEELPVGFMILGVEYSHLDPVTKQFIPAGNTTGYKLTGVLFSDGTFYGNDVELQRLTGAVALYRNYARKMQNDADRERQMDADSRLEYQQMASMPPELQPIRTLAATIIMVRNNEGPGEMNKALARIADIPELRKGQ
jgi:hypothetical protein